MTKKDAEWLSLVEASEIVNKSVRTIKRYLDRVDKVDKKRMSTLSKGRILVSLEFVDLVESGFFKNSTKKKFQESFEGKKEMLSEKDKRIEILESKNKELFEIIKDKDKQLQGKDELIKENFQDFKTLTSKVLFLQEENKKLQIAPSVENVSSSILTFSKGLAYFFIVIFFFLGCWFLAYLLN